MDTKYPYTTHPGGPNPPNSTAVSNCHFLNGYSYLLAQGRSPTGEIPQESSRLPGFRAQLTEKAPPLLIPLTTTTFYHRKGNYS